MDDITKTALASLCEKHGFDEDETKLLEYSRTYVTEESNHAKVYSTLILSKQLEKSVSLIVDSNNTTKRSIVESNERLKYSEDKNSKVMQWLTAALIFVGAVQATSMVIQVIISSVGAK